VRAEALVAVGVEHWHKDQGDLIEHPERDAVVQNFAQRQEPGVFAVDLPGVNSRLDEHRGTFPGDEHQHRATF